MAQQSILGETYLKAKRYLTFFSGLLVLSSAVGLSPSGTNGLGLELEDPSRAKFVLYAVVLYYFSQLALFWDAQGKQVKALRQHSIDFFLSSLIGLGGLLSLPISMLVRRCQIQVIVEQDAGVILFWGMIILLLVGPFAGILLYRWVFKPQIVESRDKVRIREDEILAVLTSRTDWHLVFNPQSFVSSEGKTGIKPIRFGDDGDISVGKNMNEHSWRIVSGFLEILNDKKEVFSRFSYAKNSNTFIHTDDDDALSIRNQYIRTMEDLLREKVLP